VETVDGVWNTKLGLVQRIDLGWVTKIGFARDDMSGTFGRDGLVDIGQDEVDVGGLLVLEQFGGELENGSAPIMGQNLQSDSPHFRASLQLR